MAYLPKDFSRHESKIIAGLSAKTLGMITFFLVLIALILKLSFIGWIFKIVLIIPITILALFCIFYRSQDDDDFATYVFKLIAFYLTPKYLVYKKISPDERKKNIEQKNGQKHR